MSSTKERWSGLTEKAASQHGLLTRRQLLEVLSRKELETRARAGVIEPVAWGVYRIAGSPHTWRQRVLASCLHVGPVVAASHITAARLWGFESVDARRRRIHLSVPVARRGARTHLDARIHRSALDERDMTRMYAIPTTTAIRTLTDLAAVVSGAVLAHCADEALRRDMVRPADLEVLEDIWRRRGAPAIRAVAEARAGGVGESVWEDRVFGWLIAAGCRRRSASTGWTSRAARSGWIWPTPSYGWGSSSTGGSGTGAGSVSTGTGSGRPSCRWRTGRSSGSPRPRAKPMWSAGSGAPYRRRSTRRLPQPAAVSSVQRPEASASQYSS